MSTDSNITVNKIKLSFADVEISSKQIGDDLFICVSGGERPHIGCTVLAIPRPSLTGDGSISATSSVLNVTGHKDEAICRLLAERAAAARNCTVVCTGGFHMDNITPDQISELMNAIGSASS